MKPLRVLVVDDSAMNRQTIGGMLSAVSGVQVVGSASDGDEALALTSSLRPDLITLDLEMPRMDGFTFLRLLMASRPTPVVIISSYAAKENVFRALELGAIDFIAKPQDASEMVESKESVEAQLHRMVKMVRQLSPYTFKSSHLAAARSHGPSLSFRPLVVAKKRPPVSSRRELERLIVVASSTGGPAALLEVFAQLPTDACAAIIVAQHMPERFTRTFAERLDRLSAFQVREARDVQELAAGLGLVCPGGRSVEVCLDGDACLAKVVWPASSDRYAPSADRLFSSAAEAMGSRVIAVVLTGMGDDGARGVAAVKRAGGKVFVEAEESAVIYGMPRAAHRTGHVDETLPLRRLADRLAQMIS